MSGLLTRHSNESIVFRIERRSGVWQVTRDGKFCGDFLTRRSAVEAAEALAGAFEALGGVARVDAAPAKGDAAVQDASLRTRP